jgi:integrase
MSEPHPTPAGKPAKPHPDFPLFPHATRRWAKKIRGKLHYFGPWDDPDGALDNYLKQKDDLHAGRRPRPDPAALTVRDLCEDFLAAKQAAVDAEELTRRSWADYKVMCDILVSHFGKGRLVEDLGPDDFAALRAKLARRWGPVALGANIQKMRCVFKFASDNTLIPRPVVYGQAFKRPSKKTVRLDRARKGAKLFTADELRRLLGAAGTRLRAMILLAINCGLGNSDIGNLPLSALDLERGWLDYPRPKTGLARRAALWPETVVALREALAKRPAPKDPADAGLVFITKYGHRWHEDNNERPLSMMFGQLLRSLGINGRHRLGFYTLRHTFRTVADEARDQPACDFVMGHEIPHMSSIYRETISDARLRGVADHVRTWLFAKPVE